MIIYNNTVKGILALMIGCSCGSVFQEEGTGYYVNEFSTYARQFGRPEAADEAKYVEVVFGSVEAITKSKDAVGVCDMDGPKRITLSKTFWNNSSVDERRILLFHELGHCVLYRDHDDDRGIFSIDNDSHRFASLPSSIMNETVIGDRQLKLGGTHYKEYLVSELFITPGLLPHKKVK